MNNDGRIRDERFCQDRRREVDYSTVWTDRTGLIGSNAEITANLLEIIRRLGNGDLIPDKFYRNGIDRDYDELLDIYGIKHLHLSEDTDDDALLFLIEYHDFVLLLEADGHRQHFNKPVGSVLHSLHSSSIRNADTKAAKIKAEKVVTMKAALRPRAVSDEQGAG